MVDSGIISNYQKMNSNHKKYFYENIFDEDFFNEKDKALSPIVLSDEISGGTIKKSIEVKKEKKLKFKIK